jgi:hypothetical protein
MVLKNEIELPAEISTMTSKSWTYIWSYTHLEIKTEMKKRPFRGPFKPIYCCQNIVFQFIAVKILFSFEMY